MGEQATARTPVRKPAAIPLGRWFGIEVGADFSWLIIALLITLSLSNQFADQHPDWSSANHYSLGLLTSALFFVSIVLHELGHSLVAIRFGIPVRSITLFIFGGVAWLEREPERPGHEFAIALAGPGVSLALSLIFGGVALGLGADSVLGTAAVWLSRINLSLFVFNLIPGFPLDGGRVLRAILWHFNHSLSRSTTIAAGVGSLVAYAFMGIGVYIALVSGSLFSGLWIGFIGWFLLSAAKSSATHGVAQEVLSRISASEVMDTSCDLVSPAESLQAVVDRGVLRRGQRCFLVGTEGNLRGLLTIHEIRAVDQDDWSSTSVQGAMLKLEDLRTIEPGTDLFEGMRVMDEGGVNQLPVVSDGRLVGVLTRERLLGVLRNQMEFRT